MAKDTTHCSFCGREKKDTNMLIAGLEGHICDHCVSQASAIVAEELISKNLYTADQPEPELIIRPGGEYRLSNFLLWQSSYSELYFSPILWPDFNENEFDKSIIWYQDRDRRMGK